MTVAVVAPVELAVRPPGAAVTVYPVMAEPPSLTGAVHDTTAWAFPAVAEAPVGAPGAVADGVVTDVSSMTNEVTRDASSEPEKERAMVWPTYADRFTVLSW